MDEREYHSRLETTAEDPGELFEHFERRSAAGRTYYALSDARHGVERGTVVLPDADAVVRGFPSVPRTLVLDPGVPSFFGESTTVAIEEKLDGFNVRIADVGEPLAFTRSGYVCPFTTGRSRERLPLSEFFADHPGAMLCAELIGPETPYTTHEYDEIESHAFRVFGIRDRESGDPLPVDERREHCATYGFDQPQLFGICPADEAVEAIRDAVATLDAAGREGVVVRSERGDEMLKYTTESQHHAELAYAFSLPFDRGREFAFSRIIREAFQAAEFDENDERLRERARDLGESILLPAVETIEDVESNGTIGERHTVRGDPDRIDALLDHLHEQSLTLEIERDSREGGDRVVEFVKVAESTRDRIQHYLDGGTIDV
jgi:putative ATP-dependent DNA ligase